MRHDPAISSAATICCPLSHTLALKLTPPKCSQTLRPAASAGSVNSVRYHHGTRKGLSSGISMSEKLPAISYSVPGMSRTFMA